MARPSWPERPLVRGRVLRLDRPLVMAILNATPDSFSDGGQLPPPDSPEFAALIRRMLADGADLFDVGGESTRPGHAKVPADEELRRVLPFIRAIRAVAPDAVISIDTRKADVARAALAAGADLVNDVGGLADSSMAAVVRDAGCSIVLMRSEPCRGDVVEAAAEQLAGLVERAKAAGLSERQLILDPGLGFGDPPGGDPVANMALLEGVPAYGPFPVLVGASRKRFIGTLTGEGEPAKRVAGSVAAAVLAVKSGAAIVRVHDVAATVAGLRAVGLR